MAGHGGKFSAQEIEYLRSVPAVLNVTANRITYTDSFKSACLERYLDGESPVRMFREAGMPPELIGYKRIERCFARWKTDKDRLLKQHNQDDRSDTEFFGTSPYVSAEAEEDARTVQPQPADAPSRRAFDGPDIRDLLIIQQIHHIDSLERRVERLQRELSVLRADDSGTPSSMDLTEEETSA